MSSFLFFPSSSFSFPLFFLISLSYFLFFSLFSQFSSFPQFGLPFPKSVAPVLPHFLLPCNLQYMAIAMYWILYVSQLKSSENDHCHVLNIVCVSTTICWDKFCLFLSTEDKYLFFVLIIIHSFWLRCNSTIQNDAPPDVLVLSQGFPDIHIKVKPFLWCFKVALLAKSKI